MTSFIGINGMGRIGRLLLRRTFSQNTKGIVKAINAIYPVETIAHLLKYDTVHGTWEVNIQTDQGDLIIDGQRIAVVNETDPLLIPWEKLGVELVLEATGRFTDRKGAEKHLAAGAASVIVTAPGKQLDLTVVMGVNEQNYDPSRHVLLSTASCTTNCVAPVLKILDNAFNVQNGWMTTIHSFTNDQNHLDNPHQDLRRARACGQSIIPTSTGVGKALADVLPHLAPNMQGLSVRVPTPNVSLIDLTVQVTKPVHRDEVVSALKSAAANAASYIGYSEEPLVSSDYIGSEKSAVIDGLSLMAAGNQVKVLAWYDNEWAYACRVVDFAEVVLQKREEKAGLVWKHPAKIWA